MKLGQQIGSRSIPLSYVLDDTIRHATLSSQPLLTSPTPILDITDDVKYMEKAVHFGKAFKEDNVSVWTYLKDLLLGKPGYNHISRFDRTRNGREAWMTLRQFYEGRDFQERMRESAFAKLTNTFYKGESSRFNFEKYIDVHKSAHKMLEDCGYNNGLGMDDATKAQHFKSGIKQDAGLEIALTQIRATHQSQSFDALTSFLTAEVEHKSTRRQQIKSVKDRRVSSAQSNKPYHKKGKRVNGNKKNIPSRMVDGTLVYGKRYPKDEFSSLTKSQRSAVMELQRQYKRSTQSVDTSTHSISAMHQEVATIVGNAIVAGVQQTKGEDVSVITEPPPNNTGDNSTSPCLQKRKATSGAIGDFIRKRRQNE